MDSAWFDFLGLFSLLAVLGALVVFFSVWRELAPAGGLSGRGRWLLSAGLGLGVLAFAAKAAAIALMVALPQATLEPLAGLRQVDRLADSDVPLSRPGFRVTGPYVWRALPAMAPAPEGNTTTPEKVALGERLFHDRGLSLDRSVACASCHDVLAGAGVDGRPTSLGIAGQLGGRNAPTVWNAAFQARLFLDGRAASLEDQAKGPPVNPLEMGMHSLEAVAARVAAQPAYRQAFAQAMGGARPIDIDAVVEAIAAYERTLITADTPYDRFLAGDQQALSAAQKRGMALFESVGCVVCHQGPNFSSASLFDARVPYRLFPAFSTPASRALTDRYHLLEDLGRAPPQSRRGVWKVPSLRNVALTGPYFHNGSVDKLDEAVRIMATTQLGRHIVAVRAEEGGAWWSARDRALHRAPGRDLGEAEVADLVAFLESLTSQRLVTTSASP